MKRLALPSLTGSSIAHTRMELLTPEEVARITGLSPETLAQWRSLRRHIPFIKLGRSVRYLKTDVEEYVRKCRVSVSGQETL